MVDIDAAAWKLLEDNEASIEHINFFIESDIESLVEAAENVGGSADYLVEKILEFATERISTFKSQYDRVKKYWLYLDNVPGGTHFEANIRAAEFLAEFHKQDGIMDDELTKMASHEDWQIRLVSAWIVRDAKSGEAKKIKEQLASDPFEDDNGIYLVREGAGYCDD